MNEKQRRQREIRSAMFQVLCHRRGEQSEEAPLMFARSFLVDCFRPVCSLHTSQVMHPDQSSMASSAISGAHLSCHHMCCITALSQGRVWPRDSSWRRERLVSSLPGTQLDNKRWQMDTDKRLTAHAAGGRWLSGDFIPSHRFRSFR